MQHQPSKENSNNALRNASEDYILGFENGPFLLNYDDLNEHVDKADIKRKKFNWPSIKIVYLKDGLLQLSASSLGDSYIITIQVEKDELKISCNCGMQVYKLCNHAYHTIYKLALCKSAFYFEQFVSGGLAETAFDNKDYFLIKESEEGITINSKPTTGKVFIPKELSVAALSNLLKLSLPAATIYNLEVPEEIVTGYAIVCSRLQYHPPFLVPFYGKLNNAGNEVKTFIDFIRYEKDMPALNFSEGQRIVNTVSIEMKKLATELPAKLLGEPKFLPAFFSLFHLWEKVLPLISKEDFVYEYYVHMRFLKERPRKQYMHQCIVHKERPQIRLRLSIEKELYKLKIIVAIHGKPVKYAIEDSSFLLQVGNMQENFYLLSSLKDAMFLEWMSISNNCITVFKLHQAVFLNGLLKQLSEYYPLECPITYNIHQLKPVKKFIQISDKGRWILLTLFIEYDDGTLINAFTNGTGWISEKDNQQVYIQRDKKYEENLKEFIKSLHNEFINQNADSYYFSKKCAKKNNWFQKVQTIVEKAGIEIKGVENLK